VEGKNKIIVGVSDAKLSRSANDVIITYSLGSCIAVCVYEKNLRIGGLLHFQLPESKLDVAKAIARPFMFADTGMKLLLQSLVSAGAQKRHMSVKIAGGAAMRNGPANFDIGKRNYLAIRKCLWQAGLLIESEDVGGENPRSLFLDIETGQVRLKINQQIKEF